MALHKLLVDDFYDESYCLIAIHSRLPDYRLAYMLNKQLELRLHRLDQDLDYKYFAATYSIYEWIDERQQITWNLISNVCQKEEDMLSSSGSLFEAAQKTVKTYHLLPELKNVDYLLKITCEANKSDEQRIVDQLHNIPQVITSYNVDVSKIKSKEFLIF
ncbi:MAG: IPExxxVDY family protein [Flavobacteriaceae bacterium]|nr:IPExxxVDY family protein [Flavobacteriaceae bacterium]